MEVFKSIANDGILGHYKQIRGRSLMNHASNTCGIEETIAVASLYCPEIVEVNGCIFISEFYNGNIDRLEKLYGGDRLEIEMFVNSWSLSGFFLLANDESAWNDEIVEEFGKILKYFWDRRLKELFPQREIVVELGYEIMGEIGLTITVYQK